MQSIMQLNLSANVLEIFCEQIKTFDLAVYNAVWIRIQM